MSAVIARHKFRIGQRVKMTAEAIAGNLGATRHGRTRRSSDNTGTVKGYGREPHLVRVLPDGVATVASYHADYCEPLS